MPGRVPPPGLQAIRIAARRGRPVRVTLAWDTALGVLADLTVAQTEWPHLALLRTELRRAMLTERSRCA